MSQTNAPARSRSDRLREQLSGLHVAPSILAADYTRLGSQLDEVLSAGARVIHVDVMDGHFVAPITIGALVVSAIADQVHAAEGVIDTHLMVERPERHIAAFAAAGADVITIHAEATPHVHYALGAIHEAGALAGLALNPGTDTGVVSEVLELLDLVLCMTVNPGWGGQSFIASTASKIERLRGLLPEPCALQVDGGVGLDNARACVERGANLLVAGSAVFGHSQPAEAYRRLILCAGALRA